MLVLHQTAGGTAALILKRLNGSGRNENQVIGIHFSPSSNSIAPKKVKSANLVLLTEIMLNPTEEKTEYI